MIVSQQHGTLQQLADLRVLTSVNQRQRGQLHAHSQLASIQLTPQSQVVELQHGERVLVAAARFVLLRLGISTSVLHHLQTNRVESHIHTYLGALFA